uniref:BRCA2-interacting transcriptional repressor EMSY n=1 Tax=Denticeps clupeoides TaxID=299321 RepID=A0AAY4DL05_9TELE
MPVVWPTLLDLGRDECKRILRKLELEAYAGVISALRAQGDLTKDKKDLLGELTKVLSISTERHRAEVRRAVNDERLTTIISYMFVVCSVLLPLCSMSGPNSSSEWSIEGRRLVPLMPRLVPQTAFTVTANTVANATAHQNSSLLLPAETGNKEGVSCTEEDEKPRKRRRTNSSGSSPVLLKEVPKVAPPISKTITVPVSGSPKMSIMQSIANSLPPHMSPVKITFTKPTTQTTNTPTQKVIIVTTSPSSSFVPNILSKSHNYAAMSKLVSTSILSSSSQKQTVVIPASSSLSSNPSTVAVTSVVSSTPSVVMSTLAQGATSAAVKVASARLPSPKTLVGSPTQIIAQFPKQHQQSPKQLQLSSPISSPVGSGQTSTTPPGSKPTIQIKQESGVKIITQQVQPSKILPKPSSTQLPSSSTSPIMVVSSNGAIMTTKLVTTPTGTQATYSRPTVSPTVGARMATSAGGATYVKTTSGSIITVVPKSLATLGGKIISSNIVSGTTTKITTIPMTSKPNVIVVQKTTGKGTTIQGLPGKNVVTTLLNAGGEKTLQAVPGAKPAIITASRPITKMIVTQPKSMGSGVQPTTTTKIIPTKIVYGQQGKTQVLIKPKPMTFQTAVVSEQTRQLVSETLQQVSRAAESGLASGQEGALKDDSTTESSSPSAETLQSELQPVVHVIASRGQEWPEHEVAMETSPTIIYQDVSGESQSATSTIKALLELQQTTVKEKVEPKPRQHTIDLSQMAVPIQMAQDKRQSPEPPGQGESEAFEVTLSSSQPQVVSCQTTGPTSSIVTLIRISFLLQVGGTAVMHNKQTEEQVVEEGELEGDTLDPQTGLFYRSSQPSSQPPSQQGSSQAAQPEPSRPTPHSTQPQQIKPPPSSSPSTSSPSSVKRAPVPHEHPPPKASTQPSASVKEKPPLASGGQPVVQVLSVKAPHTPQLPKLQQAPTSHNRPNIHTQLSQPPPLQAHHPVVSDKTSSGQVQQPIITQGATVTKITFGSHQSPPVSSSAEAAAKLLPESSSGMNPEKSSVSDILKISMMEAEIDPSAEPMVVDSSPSLSMVLQWLEMAIGVKSVLAILLHCSESGSSDGQIWNLFWMHNIKNWVLFLQVIPQYSIMPDSSQSNVVVEPSGFLEITDYTSQRLDDESMMEPEVDSSNDEGAAASPMEGCADQSQ